MARGVVLVRAVMSPVRSRATWEGVSVCDEARHEGHPDALGDERGYRGGAGDLDDVVAA